MHTKQSYIRQELRNHINNVSITMTDHTYYFDNYFSVLIYFPNFLATSDIANIQLILHKTSYQNFTYAARYYYMSRLIVPILQVVTQTLSLTPSLTVTYPSSSTLVRTNLVRQTYSITLIAQSFVLFFNSNPIFNSFLIYSS